MHPGLKLALQIMGGGAAIGGLGNIMTPKNSYWESVDRNAGGETPYDPEEQRALRRKGLRQDIVNGAGLGIPNLLLGNYADEKKGHKARMMQAAATMQVLKMLEQQGVNAKMNPQKYGYMPDDMLMPGDKPDTDLF